MVSCAPEAAGVVPIPMFEVTTRVKRLLVPETFTLVVKMFEVVRAFDRYAFPTT
jgi:hypothetical protein